MLNKSERNSGGDVPMEDKGQINIKIYHRHFKGKAKILTAEAFKGSFLPNKKK